MNNSIKKIKGGRDMYRRLAFLALVVSMIINISVVSAKGEKKGKNTANAVNIKTGKTIFVNPRAVERSPVLEEVTIICPSCGEEVPGGISECPSCGASL
ncbi:zinc-ribbon domain-containing protein [Candidatus Omnitrophota bacterium]